MEGAGTAVWEVALNISEKAIHLGLASGSAQASFRATVQNDLEGTGAKRTSAAPAA